MKSPQIPLVKYPTIILKSPQGLSAEDPAATHDDDTIINVIQGTLDLLENVPYKAFNGLILGKAQGIIGLRSGLISVFRPLPEFTRI